MVCQIEYIRYAQIISRLKLSHTGSDHRSLVFIKICQDLPAEFIHKLLTRIKIGAA